MRNFLSIFFAVAIFLLSGITNASTVKSALDGITSRSANTDRYVAFHLGPLMPVSGYGNMDPRFFMQFEYASPNYYALPINFSFGDSLFIMGLKPRLQYWIQPSKKYPIKIAPSFGGVFNYWTYTGSGVDIDEIEFGFQIAAQIRYDVLDDLFVSVTPFSLDINFWRYVWTTVGDTSQADAKLMYQLAFGVGYKF
jgi:hypothetical protein